MMCLEIIVYASIWFAVGWIIRSISVAKIVKQAKHDIKYVNTIKSKEYRRGWKSGNEYRSEYGKK